MRFIKAVWNYVKDWKNLLTHGLIGVGILILAILVPVPPIYRIIGLIIVVAFNIIRMEHTKRYLGAKK